MGFNMFIKEFFMKVIINPTKPFYLDELKKRLGVVISPKLEK